VTVHRIAISPSDEIDNTSAFDSPNGRDSGLSGRVTKSSIGFPSQAALYTMFFPSGAKRAIRMVPPRKVN